MSPPMVTLIPASLAAVATLLDVVAHAVY